METKEQPIQNPENGTIPNINKEPLLAADAENTNQVELVDVEQISKIEKSNIVDLLQGKIEESKTEVKDDASAGISNSIEVAVNQISESEKQIIIDLLRNNPDKVNLALYDNIDFDNLNKQELVETLEEIVEEMDISLVKTQVSKISTAYYSISKKEMQNELNEFVSAGGKEDDFKHVEDNLETRFNAAIGKYRYNKSKFTQNLEQQKQVNLKLKYELLEELKTLIASEETLKKTYDEFKKLQDRWKEIGQVPATELRNLWQSYHFLVEKFFDKVRINRELRDLDLKKNLEAKVALCEKAEELIVEKSIIKSFKLLQFYHDKWREIGPVPSDVKDTVWNRFKGITDKINLRRKEHYKEIQEEQETNYETKKVLCEQIKAVVDKPVDTLKGWQSSTEKVNELLSLWKKVGRAPKAKNDEIWDTFKGSLDKFFNAKREYLGELKEQQVNNYNLKLDLCAKAESIMESSNWGDTTRELIGLQKEWKKIGPVPRKYSDKVWKRFRSACDNFFNRKTEHFKSIHGVEDENLKNKKNLIASILEYKIVDDKNANLKAIKDFQKQWIEIGFVPFKEKEKIQTQYRTAVDQLFNKMDVSKAELSTSDFKDKMEVLRSGPDGDKRLSKERAFISSKIRKIQEDLDVWENNIGFFSNSKQSNKLVDGFRHKIEKAKNEIASLKERLKLIN